MHQTSQSKDDFLDLWKYFQEDSSQIKGRLWTITTWLYVLLTGLLGFIAKFLTTLSEHDAPLSDSFFIQPVIVLVLSAVGIGLCWFTGIMITSYGKHIITSWKRANYILSKNKELKEIWESGYEGKSSPGTPNLPPEVKKLNGLTIGFSIIYTITFLLAFIEIVS